MFVCKLISFFFKKMLELEDLEYMNLYHKYDLIMKT